MEAPEKIYLQVCRDCKDNDCKNCKFKNLKDNITWYKDKIFDKDIEYTCTDAFIEKALKWYCLDCACNDNCATNHKCAFWSFFKDYLEGNDKALPPKIGNAFNPDGSTTENYRYRHIIERMQDDFIKKACDAYCEVCGHYHHTVPYEICRHNCDYYKDFKKHLKEE